MKDLIGAIHKNGVCQPSHYPLTPWAIVLQRFAIFHCVVKTNFFDDALQIAEPHNGCEFYAAPPTFCLLHFFGSLLIEFHADRGRALDDMKQLAER